MQRPIIVVIPCFNEEKRLQTRRFSNFASQHPDVGFLFVDDGSKDSTGEILEKETASHPGYSKLLSLRENVGKGEAVRRGMQHAITCGAEYVAYWDADLATPIEELVPMIQLLTNDPDMQGILGSRVKLLGYSIHRRTFRHYIGRTFATVASIVLDLPVYDTQCGAKVFRVTDDLSAVLASPFNSKWIFDAELLFRLKGRLGEKIQAMVQEYPVRRWEDVAGSKLRLRDFFIAALDLSSLWWREEKRDLPETGEGR
jgi:glycosyltransferase involved in cell wall biosynthesis